MNRSRLGTFGRCPEDFGESVFRSRVQSTSSGPLRVSWRDAPAVHTNFGGISAPAPPRGGPISLALYAQLHTLDFKILPEQRLGIASSHLPLKIYAFRWSGIHVVILCVAHSEQDRASGVKL